MSRVRFSATDIRMLLSLILVLIAGTCWFVRATVDHAVDKLQLTMATTYVSKDEFKQSDERINQRLSDVHQDVSRLTEEKKK